MSSENIVSYTNKSFFMPLISDQTSDANLAISELYEHHCLLFCAWAETVNFFCKTTPYGKGFWKSRKKYDGTILDGWFIAGIDLSPTTENNKLITYHLPNHMWDLCHADELEVARFDGHTSSDILDRLREWIVYQP